MILYLDSSAIVKLYVTETGSEEVKTLLKEADIVGTALISRAEVVAAFAKAIRAGLLPETQASAAVQVFRSQWPDFARIQVTEATTSRAESLAWSHGLRGYDAVHLASALSWQEALGEPVTMATFDRKMHAAGMRIGLTMWPDSFEGS
jgi:predicted nucleic acid-binding protein